MIFVFYCRVFNRFSKFLIQNRICIVSGFCCWFNFFCFLRGFNFFNFFSFFCLQAGPLHQDTRALATGLVSGAFSDVVVGLATASVFGCASVFVPPVSSAAACALPFYINNKSVLIATDATPSDDFLIE